MSTRVDIMAATARARLWRCDVPTRNPEELLTAARGRAADVVADRREIHRHPELKFQEHVTAELVANRLRGLGVEVKTGVGETGVVGLLRGGRPGKTVLLRADMDALPIEEQSDVDYRSQNPGVMHACGHDGHTAMLLGVARLLSEIRDQIPGCVKLMFQPGEEGGAGALRMIEQGLLEDPPVDAAFALHVDALHYAGEVALRTGPTMAAVDDFIITVRGKGGHAARPHLAVDPVVIAAHVVTALQTIVSREVDPNDQAVVTVGSVVSGTTFNVIPDVATIKGTIRTYSPDLRKSIAERIRELASAVAGGMRATAEMEYFPGYPPLVNHESGIELVRGAVTDLLGLTAIVPKEQVMGAEDFAYVLELVPDGAMFHLGVRDRSWAEPRPIHSSSFDMNEDALPLGVAALAATALRFLDST
jgi:amidohydrolase